MFGVTLAWPSLAWPGPPSPATTQCVAGAGRAAGQPSPARLASLSLSDIGNPGSQPARRTAHLLLNML